MYRLSLLFFLFLVHMLPAQDETRQPVGYLGISGLGDYSYYRDYGISPLKYAGILSFGKISWMSQNPKWLWTVEGGSGVGTFKRYLGETYTSSSTTFLHGCSVLRTLPLRPDSKWNLRLGVVYHGYTNIRVSPAFLNASGTLESINTIFTAVRLEWFIGKQSLDRNRHQVNVQLQVPVVNTSWRPGFSYISDFTDGATILGDRNEFLIGGIRLQNRIHYMIQLINGNAWNIGYIWDAFSGPGDFNRLEFAHHQLELSFLIRLK